MQDIKLDRNKPKRRYLKNNEKITTNSELSNDEDVINKANLDTKLSRTEGHITSVEKKKLKWI